MVVEDNEATDEVHPSNHEVQDYSLHGAMHRDEWARVIAIDMENLLLILVNCYSGF